MNHFTSRAGRLLGGAAASLLLSGIPAAAAVSQTTEFHQTRCLERVGDPVRATQATFEAPAGWDKYQRSRSRCYFHPSNRSMQLEVDLEGLDTRVRHVRKERAELKAAAEHNHYREKRWTVRGKELRWVFASRGHTYRIALSQGIRLELPSFHAENGRADRIIRHVLRTLDVRQVQR